MIVNQTRDRRWSWMEMDQELWMGLGQESGDGAGLEFGVNKRDEHAGLTSLQTAIQEGNVNMMRIRELTFIIQ